MIFLLFYRPYFCIVTVFWSLTLYSSSHHGVEVRVPWILVKREGKRLCSKVNTPEKKNQELGFILKMERIVKFLCICLK